MHWLNHLLLYFPVDDHSYHDTDGAIITGDGGECKYYWLPDYALLDTFCSTSLSDVDEHESPKEYPDFDLSAISKIAFVSFHKIRASTSSFYSQMKMSRSTKTRT